MTEACNVTLVGFGRQHWRALAEVTSLCRSRILAGGYLARRRTAGPGGLLGGWAARVVPGFKLGTLAGQMSLQSPVANPVEPRLQE